MFGMKVGILSFSPPEGGGVYQYTISLLEAVNRYSNAHEYIQIRYDHFPKILNKDIVLVEMRSSILLKIARLINIFVGPKLGELVPNVQRRLTSEIDIIISPHITLLPYYIRKPYIVTIHDFQQEYYPAFFTLKERILRKIVYRTGKFANIVIVESNFVKKDVMKFLNVEEDRIKVIPSPPPSYVVKLKLEQNIIENVINKYNLPDKYIFYPAQFWPHKNHINLIKALKFIKYKQKEEIPLILVGSKKKNFENVMKKIKELNIENQVSYLGYILEEEMPYIYNLSTALVMPTLFESVSLPIWEAFYLGVPVVSSNVCALPEQVGDAGLLFDPTDIEDMADKIYHIWTNESLRKELIQKGYQRVKDLTIENYAKQWEEIIEEALRKDVVFHR